MWITRSKSIVFVGNSTGKTLDKNPAFVHLLVIGEKFSSFRAALHKRVWKLLAGLIPECGGHTALMTVYI
jgi:hypothetical protein